ncbi:MAG: GGDEF domain-containing protein, partial [Marinomonas sp.]
FLVDGEEVVLWMASNITERHDMEAKLRELSDTDQLTGLFNRRRLERDLMTHYRTFVESNKPTSILVFDLDNLKTINDTLGHFVGDEVIMAVGHICRGSLNNDGMACRFGGDEFVIALPNIELAQAMVFAELLHGRFEAHFNRFFAKSLASVISVSIGIAEIIPSDTSYETALKRADDALYQAKRAGKNRTMMG